MKTNDANSRNKKVQDNPHQQPDDDFLANDRLDDQPLNLNQQNQKPPTAIDDDFLSNNGQNDDADNPDRRNL